MSYYTYFFLFVGVFAVVCGAALLWLMPTSGKTADAVCDKVFPEFSALRNSYLLLENRISTLERALAESTACVNEGIGALCRDSSESFKSTHALLEAMRIQQIAADVNQATMLTAVDGVATRLDEVSLELDTIASGVSASSEKMDGILSTVATRTTSAGSAAFDSQEVTAFDVALGAAIDGLGEPTTGYEAGVYNGLVIAQNLLSDGFPGVSVRPRDLLNPSSVSAATGAADGKATPRLEGAPKKSPPARGAGGKFVKRT